MNETVVIKNPCYHCYMGAIGECIRCKHFDRSWHGDLESDMIEIDETEPPEGDNENEAHV